MVGVSGERTRNVRSWSGWTGAVGLGLLALATLMPRAAPASELLKPEPGLPPAVAAALADRATADPETVAPMIVGGTAVGNARFRNQFRWMVALIHEPSEQQFCGGALIDAQWVLTAAHCLEDIAARNISVLVGTPRLSAGGELVPVSRMVLHPDYDPATNDNDIAVLRLERRLTTLPLVALPTPAQDNALTQQGDRLRALGWGDTTEGGSGPDRLREVVLPVVSNATCRAAYPNDPITDSMLCAGRASGGIDTCQGDSGGPLVARAGGRWVQMGVTSWGIGCARPNRYGVYTRVADFTDWIAASLEAEPVCSLPALAAPMRLPAEFDCLSMGRSDDGTVPATPIGFPVQLGGATFTQLSVNNNGNVTFGSSHTEPEPESLRDVGLPIIAPFFADVDTSGAASGVVHYGTGRLGSRRVFTAIWPLVGSYNADDARLNAFQLLLIERAPDSGDFQIEFNYARLDWDRRATSPSVGPRAGFALVPGRANRSVEIPGSGQIGELADGGTRALTGRSNIGVDGRFRWTIRGGRPR